MDGEMDGLGSVMARGLLSAREGAGLDRLEASGGEGWRGEVGKED